MQRKESFWTTSKRPVQENIVKLSKSQRKRQQLQILTRIREYHRKTGKVPSSRAFGESFKVHVSRFFGAWSTAVKEALNVDVQRHHATREEILQAIREEYDRTGKLPTSVGLGSILKGRHKKLFSSWDEAVRLAIGKSAAMRRWTDQEILSLLREFVSKHNRFPMSKDLDSLRKSLKSHIQSRFETSDDALELAVGNSPRREILKALYELSNIPGQASSHEIKFFLDMQCINARGQYTVRQIGIRLDEYSRRGFVTKVSVGTVPLWKLTALGHQEAKRGDDPSSKGI